MTLQDQYTQIQEGKGNKDHFLKQARYLFPEFVNHYNSYNETVNILKSKMILTESKAGLGMVSTNGKRVEDWISIFQESAKAEEKKTSKEVLDNQSHNFDYKDLKNIDNVYGNSFLNGFYAEMQDPKNKNKTTDEVKQIVAKNLGKDWNYYAKNAQFGVKGIGYQREAPALGEPITPKGKYKSSGYGDLPKKKAVKESLNENKKEREFIKHLEDLAAKRGLITPEEEDDEDAKIHDKIINALYNIYDRKFYDKETFTDADYKDALDMLAKKIKRPLNEGYESLTSSEISEFINRLRKNKPDGITPSDLLEMFPNMHDANMYPLLVATAKANLLNYSKGGKIPPASIEKIIDRRGMQATNALVRPGRFNEITVNKPNISSRVDPTYTHFALNKKDGKIYTGWEYNDLDRDEIMHWAKGDLKDMDLKPSEFTILSVKALKQKGIDPFKWSSWRKYTEEVNENEEYEDEEDNDYLEFTDGETTVSVYKDGNKWREGKVIDGEEPYGWGGKSYMSYLKPSDIASYLRSDYGGNWKSI